MRKALFIGLLVAACSSPEFAPEACLPLADETVHIGENAAVAICFEDADGQDLKITAVSSNEEIVTVSVETAQAIRLMGHGVGTALVTVTATDTDGLNGTALLNVDVPNRSPESSSIPPIKLTTEIPRTMIVLTDYFSDPDGQVLAFSAVSDSPELVSVGITDSLLTIQGEEVGSADIEITATDPPGLEAMETVSVLFEGLTTLLRDDFDKSLEDWTTGGSTTAVLEKGRVRIRTSSVTNLAVMAQPLLVRDWRISSNVENTTNDVWAGLMIATGNSEISSILFGFGVDASRLNSDFPKTNFLMAVNSGGGTWRSRDDWNGDFSEIKNAGERMDVAVSIDNASISIFVEGVQIHKFPRPTVEVNNKRVEIPTTMSQMVLAGMPAFLGNQSGSVVTKSIYFDWVQVDGVRIPDSFVTAPLPTVHNLLEILK